MKANVEFTPNAQTNAKWRERREREMSKETFYVYMRDYDCMGLHCDIDADTEVETTLVATCHGKDELDKYLDEKRKEFKEWAPEEDCRYCDETTIDDDGTKHVFGGDYDEDYDGDEHIVCSIESNDWPAHTDLFYRTDKVDYSK